MTAAAGADPWERGMVADWLRRTGSAGRLAATLAEPYRHQVAGDWEQAAGLWTQLGCRYEAALARSAPGEEAALRDALGIFTDLGAAAAAGVTRQHHALSSASGRSRPARGPRPARTRSA